MADLDALQQILGIRSGDLGLLEQALVHTSYVNENPALSPGSNERLEFLGDAVLGMVIAEKLYHDYPDLAEGDLTRLRAALVRGETLARMASGISLGQFLLLGKGEEASRGRQKPVNLAGALEAIIGAVYLDQGLDSARMVILRLAERELAQVTLDTAEIDYKSRLQEIIQSRQHVTPTYHLLESTGPDHSRIFTVQVRAGGAVLGTGTGTSKKLAETAAARAALECIQTTTDNR